MPKKLQIYTLKRIFRAYNKNPEFKMDLIDWDIIDSTAELSENIDMLKETYSQFCWSKHDVEGGEGIVLDRRKIEYDLEEIDETRFTKYVTVKQHKIKSKGKTYERGRIQLSTNPKFIGCTARVEVTIFVPEENKEPIPEELEAIFEEFVEQE